MNESYTCRAYVVPRLERAGWDSAPHSIVEQKTFTDGRIIPLGSRVRRGKQKRCDYLLRYTRDFPIAIVEAKAEYKLPSDGLQQAKDYAQILGLRFAYATNGKGIVEFDFIQGTEAFMDSFPPPDELWQRLKAVDGLTDEQATQLLSPYNLLLGKIPRYYQDIAINRTVQAVLQGKRRILLTMATGTGKTTTAFQICWKLWSSRWNPSGSHRRPKILYLADRNFLVDEPMLKDFAAFGDATHKIANGEIIKSREIYFAIYQALAQDERRPGLYREYSPDFFDFIIVDECHRGSARADSSWREILEYFAPATQLGLTATPLRDDNVDTYEYFGNPIFTYSLAQGIGDGFLAPYRVHRIITSADAGGWQPSEGELDRYGREIPEGEYQTKDFERVVALRARTEAIARHLTEYLKATDRFAKTIIFCVDQEHADEMRRLMGNFNTDLVRTHPDYVCRITADEGKIGRSFLSDFQDVETDVPVVVTTSQLLTTGVDAPMVKNIVLARVVGSMNEFKQIIGRGTRVRDDYGKYYFTILDYTGSATHYFADPDFDGEPARVVETTIDENGDVVDQQVVQVETDPEGDTSQEHGLPDESEGTPPFDEGESQSAEPQEFGAEPRKFYADNGFVEIIHQLVYELDAQGNRLRCVQYSEYTASAIRSLFPVAADLRSQWIISEQRKRIIDELELRGVDFEELAKATNQPDADPFDLLCHVAFNAPLRTRRERADRLKNEKQDFFAQHGPEAQKILLELLEKYAEHGLSQFNIPDVLKVPPLSLHGNVSEISRQFHGAENLRRAVSELQTLLYAA